MPAQIPVLLCDALEALQAISQGTLHSQAISHGALDLQAISHGALPLVKVHCTCRPLVKVHYTHRPSVKVHCTHRPSVKVHCTHRSLVKVHCTYRPSVKVHCTEPYIRELVLCIVSSTTCMWSSMAVVTRSHRQCHVGLMIYSLSEGAIPPNANHGHQPCYDQLISRVAHMHKHLNRILCRWPVCWRYPCTAATHTLTCLDKTAPVLAVFLCLQVAICNWHQKLCYACHTWYHFKGQKISREPKANRSEGTTKPKKGCYKKNQTVHHFKRSREEV